ncbi:MAG: hypothetical protein KME06_16510 [Kastovskya adunca ATA6-11-RM4]|jgi:hypothetical protein|nr:hypothetical protein [Kastovskya adunca ATA6-11-RM4]
MTIIICPGIHDLKLTQDFLDSLKAQLSNKFNGSHNANILIFPVENYPAYSASHILQFLQSHSVTSPLIFISFSAGVVGAMGAAWLWQLAGGKVKAFLALDGWGVVLGGNFPIHRLSHDYFTHWSSALLGTGDDSFYADPPVEHLELWRSPNTCSGWWIDPQSETRTPTTAAQFINGQLQRYLKYEG